MNTQALLSIIEEHADRSGFTPATICQYAVRNAKLYRRLLEGGECLPSTSERIVAWINANSFNAGGVAVKGAPSAASSQPSHSDYTDGQV